MIKAIICDFFGVLVGRGFDETYRKAGGDPVADREFVHDILMQANHGLISTKEFGDAFCQKLGITNEEFAKASAASEQPNFELFTYIKQLHEHYKTAILSNVNRGVLERKVDEQLLKDCFDEIIVSAEVGYVKPQNEMYEYALEKLGVEPHECIFIDDIERNVDAANNLGLRGILYKDFESFKIEIEKLLADTNS